MGFGRRKAYLKKFLVGFLIIVIITGSGFFGYVSYQRVIERLQGNYESEIEALQVEKYMKKRMVLIPIKAIEKGAVLTEDLVELKEIHSNLSQEIFAEADDFGKLTTVEYNEETPIFKNALIENALEDDDRIREISTVLLQSDLRENQVVDCRIRYANGLEFIVLSKKQVKKIDLSNNTIWLSLSEKESLLLSSALVDKAYFQGSSFYISRYIESNIQKKASVNYIPNEEIITLIEEINPNSHYSTLDKENRSALEDALKTLDEEQIAQVEEDITAEVSSVNKKVAKQELPIVKPVEEAPVIEEEATHGFN